MTSVCQLSGQHSFVGWTTCYREKRVFGLPQRKFSLWFILLLQHTSRLVSPFPTYSVIRRSPSKWGLIIVAMLKLGFWTEIGVSFVAQFWHNFCHSLVASVICQIFLFRVYKILSEIKCVRGGVDVSVNKTVLLVKRNSCANSFIPEMLHCLAILLSGCLTSWLQEANFLIVHPKFYPY